MRLTIAIVMALFCTASFAQEEYGSVKGNTVTLKEQPPVWPGCEGEANRAAMSKCFATQLTQHIIKNFQYPTDAYNANEEGVVTVNFQINKEGKVEILSTKGGTKSLQAEAKRNISLIPKMKPGTLGGKPTEIQYNVPFTFKTGKN